MTGGAGTAAVDTDEAADFLAASATFADLVDRISDELWSRPGLGEWDVRSLVGHTLRAVSTVTSYVAQARPASVACGSAGEYLLLARTVAGADPRAVAERGREAGRRLGADPGATVRAEIATVRGVLDTVRGDPVITTVVGGMRLSDYLPTRTFELTAHSLDIATATGLSVAPSGAALGSALATTVSAMAGNGDGAALLRHLLGRPGGRFEPLFG